MTLADLPLRAFSEFTFAPYVGNDGTEVAACMVSEPRRFSSDTAHPGEWLVRGTDGRVRIYDPRAFAAEFRQKYPRPVDGQSPARPPAPAPKTAI